MSKKVLGVAAAAAGVVVLGASAASADAMWNGGSATGDFANSVNAGPQNALIITNGPLVDANCLAPWSNGAVLGITFAPGSRYAACNTAPVDQANIDDDSAF